MHASTLPQEALQHVDAVVVGEAEELWPKLLADFERRALQPLYPHERYPDASKVPADHYGIPMAQVMAIGDLLNDLPMVEMAGLGVAVAHADETLKAHAQYVTDSSEQAVAEAINRFVLKTS